MPKVFYREKERERVKSAICVFLVAHTEPVKGAVKLRLQRNSPKKLLAIALIFLFT